MSKLATGDKIGSNFPYRVIEQLGKGEGGMSVVYLASMGDNIDQPNTSDLVALKIANVQSEYRQFYKDTLDNEIEHLRRLRHPGIVRLHKIRGKTLPKNAIYSARTELTDTPWFSVLEYLAGESLAELLKQQKKLDSGLALRIAHKLAKTLEYVHREGYVHLDMKPENVVFRQPITGSESIDPVLVDFGIARKIGQGGLEAGTLIWLPPERVAFMDSQGQLPEAIVKPNPKIDIYALGLILYSMLAGKLPYQGSAKKITQAILRGEPTAPSTYNSDLAPELDELVLSAIAKQPADRPTAGQFAREIEKLMNRPEYQDYQVPTVKPPSGGTTGRFSSFFISFIVTMLIGAGAFLYLQPQVRDDLMNMLGASTMTPTATVTATEVLPTATTAPTASAIPSKTVAPTQEPTSTVTIEPTSTRVFTATPAPILPPTEVPVQQPTSAPVQPTETPNQ